MSLQSLTRNGSQVFMIPFDDLMEFGEQIVERVLRKINLDKEETYLTTKQAAKMLGVDPTTLYRWDKTSYLKSVKVGSKRRYRLSDVEEILKIKK